MPQFSTDLEEIHNLVDLVMNEVIFCSYKSSASFQYLDSETGSIELQEILLK